MLTRIFILACLAILESVSSRTTDVDSMAWELAPGGVAQFFSPVGLLAPRLHDGFGRKRDAALAGNEASSKFMSFSTLEISLTVGVVVSLLVIIVLVRKIQLNSAKIKNLQDRARGLQHSLMLDHQKVVKDEDTMDALRSALAKREQRSPHQGLDSLTRAQMDEVLGREKVTVDLIRQKFELLKPIQFDDIPVTKGDPQPPLFTDPLAAKEILGDLAILLTYIQGAVILVEAHTSGGSLAMTDHGFAVASERAEFIVATLVELGIPKERLESRGCPGWSGGNSHDIKIVTLAWGY